MDALPPDVRQELVMSAAAMDSHTVTTHRFRSASPPAALLDAMRERWRAQGTVFVESHSGDWTVLSVREDGTLRTIQVRATAAGSEGLSSQWLPARRRPEGDDAAGGSPAPLADWLPVEARVLRRISHRDVGRDAATVVAIVPSSVAGAADALRRHARAAGFADDPAIAMPAGRAAWFRGGDAAGGQALAFRRGREEVVATVTAHRDGTGVVLHWGAAR